MMLMILFIFVFERLCLNDRLLSQITPHLS
jgi:hypothetical protein